MTVADLKVGDRLILGKYAIEFLGLGGRVQEVTAEPISWLKATRDGVFLSEYTIDYILFDEAEPKNSDVSASRYGNPNYALSNIRQYMNSEDDFWYQRTHEADEAPGKTDQLIYGTYVNMPGFLSGFEAYEQNAIVGNVELPTAGDILGAWGRPRFELFKRRGVRPHPSSHLVRTWRNPGLSTSAYATFWLSDEASPNSVHFIDRGGYLSESVPRGTCGFRPKLQLDPSALVENIAGTNSYRLVPYEVTKKKFSASIFSDDELSEFLGLL